MVDNKNLIMAIVLSILILFAFETYFGPPEEAVDPATQQQQAATATTPGVNGTTTPQPGASAPSTPTPGVNASVPGTTPSQAASAILAQSRQAALAQTDRVTIDAPSLHGSISLRGGLIDDLTLPDYRETIDDDSPEITLFSPRGSLNAYFTGYGWVGGNPDEMPGIDTPWSADRDTLRVNEPVTLTWDNGNGLVFTRQISIDEHYMFTVEQSVQNNTGEQVTLYPYGLIKRYGKPETTDFYILHEGLLGVLDGQLQEIDYSEIQEERDGVTTETTGGWIGITDKYWLASLIPDQDSAVTTRFLFLNEGLTDVYQTDFVGQATVIPAGSSTSVETHAFIGAKEVRLLDGYEEQLGITNFDLAIDFGWFYFLTKPIFLALLWIYDLVGNMGVAILLLTVAIKVIFFPLANKSYVAMSKMKKLQPEMVRLRERYNDDKVKLNQEMMALYKKEKVNPASGCLPILIQIPVFFALYKVLFVTIEVRHAPFFGWIQDLSAKDPTNMFNLFGLLPYDTPEFMAIGIWPLLMGISMYLQQKLNPQPADPIQAKVFLFMPLLFTFLLAQFAAGLVIYWTWNNVLSILQQWVIMRRMGIKGKEALS